MENIENRELGLLGSKIAYKSKYFNPSTYSSLNKLEFRTTSAAYKHWVDTGRALGLQYNEARNTVLKIILKVKDEPTLLEKWISHHSAIVGYENLIIMDCGSSDLTHLEILRKYRDDVLIFNYRKYYDHLHTTEANVNFFRSLSQNCRYIAILDADEFLFANDNGSFSTRNIVEKLRHSETPVFAGTWIENSTFFGDDSGELDWSSPIPISVTEKLIAAGTVAGKSIVRSSCIFDIKHIGHNLHVKEVISKTNIDSFNQFYILHLKNLHPNITRKRILKHLVAKGAIPPEINSNQQILEHLRNAITSSISDSIRGYSEKYLNLESFTNIGQRLPPHEMITLLDGLTTKQHLPALRKQLNEFDFQGLLDTYRNKFQ